MDDEREDELFDSEPYEEPEPFEQDGPDLFGMLGIDPGQIAWLGFAIYPMTQGVSSFALGVPPQSQFLGLPLYVQGLVDDQPLGVPQFTALVGTVVQ